MFWTIFSIYINHNYAENITLENIAPLFGYNSSYLGKLFNKKEDQVEIILGIEITLQIHSAYRYGIGSVSGDLSIGKASLSLYSIAAFPACDLVEVLGVTAIGRIIECVTEREGRCLQR